MSGEPYTEELVCLKDTRRDGLGEVEDDLFMLNRVYQVEQSWTGRCRELPSS